MLIHINMSLRLCVNQDPMAFDMFSHGEGVLLGIWRLDELLLLICSLLCT